MKPGPKEWSAGCRQDDRCYVSIDIDVLDLPLVPGCVSAEPNGMSYSELRDTLIAIARRMDVVGFDLVEVNSQLDVGTGITSYLAAHTISSFWATYATNPDGSPGGTRGHYYGSTGAWTRVGPLRGRQMLRALAWRNSQSTVRWNTALSTTPFVHRRHLFEDEGIDD